MLRRQHTCESSEFHIVPRSDLKSVSEAQACWWYEQAAAAEVAANVCKGDENAPGHMIDYAAEPANMIDACC